MNITLAGNRYSIFDEERRILDEIIEVIPNENLLATQLSNMGAEEFLKKLFPSVDNEMMLKLYTFMNGTNSSKKGQTFSFDVKNGKRGGVTFFNVNNPIVNIEDESPLTEFQTSLFSNIPKSINSYAVSIFAEDKIVEMGVQSDVSEFSIGSKSSDIVEILDDSEILNRESKTIEFIATSKTIAKSEIVELYINIENSNNYIESSAFEIEIDNQSDILELQPTLEDTKVSQILVIDISPKSDILELGVYNFDDISQNLESNLSEFETSLFSNIPKSINSYAVSIFAEDKRVEIGIQSDISEFSIGSKSSDIVEILDDSEILNRESKTIEFIATSKTIAKSEIVELYINIENSNNYIESSAFEIEIDNQSDILELQPTLEDTKVSQILVIDISPKSDILELGVYNFDDISQNLESNLSEFETSLFSNIPKSINSYAVSIFAEDKIVEMGVQSDVSKFSIGNENSDTLLISASDFGENIDSQILEIETF
jgi:hypothetical protein